MRNATPFDVGDRVVYPHHGAAVIERKEQRDSFGERREYLVLHVDEGELTLYENRLVIHTLMANFQPLPAPE